MASPFCFPFCFLTLPTLEPVIKFESASEGLVDEVERVLRPEGPGREREFDGCLVGEYEGAQVIKFYPTVDNRLESQ